MVALGEGGIKTVEDLADCATDDLIGWTERRSKGKDGETIRHKGILDGLGVSRADAENMVLSARVLAGWVKAEDLAAAAAAKAEAEAAAAETDEAPPATGGAAVGAAAG
jgi:N utilization substance protein A